MDIEENPVSSGSTHVAGLPRIAIWSTTHNNNNGDGNGVMTWERQISKALKDLGYCGDRFREYDMIDRLDDYDIILLEDEWPEEDKWAKAEAGRLPRHLVEVLKTPEKFVMGLHRRLGGYRNFNHILVEECGYVWTTCINHLEDTNPKGKVFVMPFYPYERRMHGYAGGYPGISLLTTSRLASPKCQMAPILAGFDGYYVVAGKDSGAGWSLRALWEVCLEEGASLWDPDMRRSKPPWVMTWMPEGREVEYIGGYSDYVELPWEDTALHLTPTRYSWQHYVLEHVTLDAMDAGVPVLVPDFAVPFKGCYETVNTFEGFEGPTKTGEMIEAIHTYWNAPVDQEARDRDLDLHEPKTVTRDLLSKISWT
jgi:hypothetical protein